MYFINVNILYIVSIIIIIKFISYNNINLLLYIVAAKLKVILKFSYYI